MPKPPPLTREEAMARLTLGNAKRFERARLHREVKAGTLSLTDLIREPPDALDTMRVHKLVQWGWHIGPKRARKMCNPIGIYRTTTVATLSPSKRAALLEALS